MKGSYKTVGLKCIKEMMCSSNAFSLTHLPFFSHFSLPVIFLPLFLFLFPRQKNTFPLALRSAVNKENPVQPIVSSFGAFEDSSAPDLGKQRSVRGTEERSLTSFSVYEDPSMVNASRQMPFENVAHCAVTAVNSHRDADVSNNRNKERLVCRLTRLHLGEN